MTKEIAQAIAKIMAYKRCNRPEFAKDWFRTLAGLLGFESMLKD